MYQKKKSCFKQKGFALIAVLIFVAVFSTLAVGMFRLSSNNVIVANNFQEANEARVAAESGLEIIRYWVDQVEIPGLTDENDRFDVMAGQLTTLINDASGNTSAYSQLEASEPHMHVGNSSSPIVLNDSGESFYARIVQNGTTGFDIEITGKVGTISRTISSSFTYGVREDNVFDYGIATKGPLSLEGNILLDGVNIAVESDVYIESADYTNALDIIGNSQISGDVKVVNPDATVTLQGGQAGIGGETGTAAIENHVEIGAPETEFPFPDTSHFTQYLSGTTMSEASPSESSYENITIPAGTNPTFSGGVELKGIIYIEQPNQVTFTGGVNITGIIVANGDPADNSATNTIDFQGNVTSNSVTALDETFDSGLKSETGTFLIAPGFKASFGGNFGTLNGCIAANGIEFYGNAGGEVGGSILNYSGEPMVLSGTNDLYFNRSGITEVPAGFVPEIVLYYDSSSYEEIL